MEKWCSKDERPPFVDQDTDGEGTPTRRKVQGFTSSIFGPLDKIEESLKSRNLLTERQNPLCR